MSSDKYIRRGDLKTHIDAVCPLEPVKCPYRDYCSQCLRRDLESHKKECDSRPHKCQHCQFAGTYISITGRGKIYALVPNATMIYVKNIHSTVQTSVKHMISSERT